MKSKSLSWYILTASVLSIVLLPWALMLTKWLNWAIHGSIVGFWVLCALGAAAYRKYLQ